MVKVALSRKVAFFVLIVFGILTSILLLIREDPSSLLVSKEPILDIRNSLGMLMVVLGYPTLLARHDTNIFNSFGFSLLAIAISIVLTALIAFFEEDYIIPANAQLVTVSFASVVALAPVLGFLSFFQTIIYSVVFALIWNFFIIYGNEFAFDAGNLIFVHIVPVFFGLMASLGVHVVNRKRERRELEFMETTNKLTSGYFSTALSLIGGLFVWTLYPMAAFLQSARVVQLSDMTYRLYHAMAIASVVALPTSSLGNGFKFDANEFINYAIASGIAVTGAIAMGETDMTIIFAVAIAGVAVAALVRKLIQPRLRRALRMVDNSNALSLHLFPGLVGYIAMHATYEKIEYYRSFVPAGEPDDEPSFLSKSVTVLVIALVISAVVGFVLGLVIARADRFNVVDENNDAVTWHEKLANVREEKVVVTTHDAAASADASE